MKGRTSVLKVCVATSFVALAASAAQAQDREWCDQYTIASGDTLSKLSNQIFGDTNAFMRFYDDPRNTESLGNNPNRISVGDTLYLAPCNPVEGEVEDVTRSVDDFSQSIDIVTATDFAPFTSEDLPDGGMLTRIVQYAFESTDLDNPVNIDFINDWGSHLETLLPRGKYSFGFPWYRPDCANRSSLSETMQVRCDLDWSDPVFSVVIGFYGPTGGSDAPQDFSGLKGRTLCRPDGYFTFDLEEEGLIPGETIDLLQPPTVQDCFEALERGDADFVTINRFTAERAIAEAGLSDLVAPIQSIVSSQDLHLVAHPFDGNAQRWMRSFNEALQEMKRSGVYSRITRQYLQQHEAEVRQLAARSE